MTTVTNTNDTLEILDTTGGETGTTITLMNRSLINGKGSYVDVTIGSGDTVVLEGKIESAGSFKPIASFTADSLIVVDLPTIFRARRTVDGVAGDTTVTIQSPGILEY